MLAEGHRIRTRVISRYENLVHRVILSLFLSIWHERTTLLSKLFPYITSG